MTLTLRDNNHLTPSAKHKVIWHFLLSCPSTEDGVLVRKVTGPEDQVAWPGRNDWVVTAQISIQDIQFCCLSHLLAGTGSPLISPCMAYLHAGSKVPRAPRRVPGAAPGQKQQNKPLPAELKNEGQEHLLSPSFVQSAHPPFLFKFFHTIHFDWYLRNGASRAGQAPLQTLCWYKVDLWSPHYTGTGVKLHTCFLVSVSMSIPKTLSEVPWGSAAVTWPSLLPGPLPWLSDNTFSPLTYSFLPQAVISGQV